MKISSENVHDVTIIAINGELDSRGNQLLDKTLKDLSSNSMYKIVIDLSTIRFVGSQTISILISNLKEIRAGGGNIKFLSPQCAVMQYLKSNRVIELFECYSSKNEAVLSFGSAKNAPPAPAPQQQSSQKQAAVTRSMPSASPAQKPHQQTKPVQPVSTVPPQAKAPVSAASNVTELGENLQAGEILYANSCILATLVKSLEKKGVLTTQEAVDLLNYEI